MHPMFRVFVFLALTLTATVASAQAPIEREMLRREEIYNAHVKRSLSDTLNKILSEEHGLVTIEPGMSVIYHEPDLFDRRHYLVVRDPKYIWLSPTQKYLRGISVSEKYPSLESSLFARGKDIRMDRVDGLGNAKAQMNKFTTAFLDQHPDLTAGETTVVNFISNEMPEFRDQYKGAVIHVVQQIVWMNGGVHCRFTGHVSEVNKRFAAVCLNEKGLLAKPIIFGAQRP